MVNRRDGNNNLAKLFVIAAILLAVIVFAMSWKSSKADQTTTSPTSSTEETEDTAEVPSAESYTESPPSSTTLNEGAGTTSTDNNPGAVSNDQ